MAPGLIGYRNLGLIFLLMIGYCAIYLLAVEYIPTERSKGEILLFRRRDLKKEKTFDDEEANSATITVTDMKRNDSSYEKPLPPAAAHNEKSSEFFHRLQKQAKVFHWNDVCYDINVSKKETRRILNNVDGWVKPGTLTALMVLCYRSTWRKAC